MTRTVSCRRSGGALIDGRGNPVVVKGVSVPLDYMPSLLTEFIGNGFRVNDASATEALWVGFTHDQAAIDAIRSQFPDVNTIRLTLHEWAWLGADHWNKTQGFNGNDYSKAPDGTPIPSFVAGAAYRQTALDFIDLCGANGLWVIIDDHWSDAEFFPGLTHNFVRHSTVGGGTNNCNGQGFGPTQSTLDFWTDVAHRVGPNRTHVLFELYNEPQQHGHWNSNGGVSNWIDGDNGGAPRTWSKGDDPGYTRTCHHVGYQVLVNAIRAAGVNNVCLLPGFNFSQSVWPLFSTHCQDDAGNWAAVGGGSGKVIADTADQLGMAAHYYPPGTEPFGYSCPQKWDFETGHVIPGYAPANGFDGQNWLHPLVVCEFGSYSELPENGNPHTVGASTISATPSTVTLSIAPVPGNSNAYARGWCFPTAAQVAGLPDENGARTISLAGVNVRYTDVNPSTNTLTGVVSVDGASHTIPDNTPVAVATTDTDGKYVGFQLNQMTYFAGVNALSGSGGNSKRYVGMVAWDWSDNSGPELVSPMNPPTLKNWGKVFQTGWAGSAIAPDTFGGPLAPAGTFARLDVSGLPKHTSSDGWIGRFGSAHVSLYSGPDGLGNEQGFPVNTPATPPLMTTLLGVDDYPGTSDAATTYPDPGGTSGRKKWQGQPDPASPHAPIEDRYYLTASPTGEMWDAGGLKTDLFDTTLPNGHVGSFAHWNAAMEPHVSGTGHPVGTTASGLPLTPLVIRQAELDAGVLAHASHLYIPGGIADSAIGWPARHTDASSVPGSFPYGTWLRIPAGFDASGLSHEAQVIVAGWKKYGVIVGDGGTGTPRVVADPRIATQTMTDIASIPMSAFEVVNTASARKFPAAGINDPTFWLTGTVTPPTLSWSGWSEGASFLQGTAFSASGTLVVGAATALGLVITPTITGNTGSVVVKVDGTTVTGPVDLAVGSHTVTVSGTCQSTPGTLTIGVNAVSESVAAATTGHTATVVAPPTPTAMLTTPTLDSASYVQGTAFTATSTLTQAGATAAGTTITPTITGNTGAVVVRLDGTIITGPVSLTVGTHTVTVSGTTQGSAGTLSVALAVSGPETATATARTAPVTAPSSTVVFNAGATNLDAATYGTNATFTLAGVITVTTSTATVTLSASFTGRVARIDAITLDGTPVTGPRALGAGDHPFTVRGTTATAAGAMSVTAQADY